MLVLKVYRMMKRLEELDMYDAECRWEYNTASSAECSHFIDKEFFEQWDKYIDEWSEIANQIYNDAKMRRIAEILDKDIAGMFSDWDGTPEPNVLPFV